ncbi:hypothetical protein BD413DRAFT_551862 [Trametes elegans]|nr:hypothetical protein BD413DRAFT_551862 [Trametes elegans]
MRKLWASLSLLARSRATLTARTPTQVALLVARPELRPPRARMHITIPSARGPQRWSSRRARIPSPSPTPHSLPATGGERDSARARRIARLTMADCLPTSPLSDPRFSGYSGPDRRWSEVRACLLLPRRLPRARSRCVRSFVRQTGEVSSLRCACCPTLASAGRPVCPERPTCCSRAS